MPSISLDLSLTTMQWAYLSWRDSENISEKWISHIQSSHTLQNFESEPDSCDVTLASKDGQILPTVDSLQPHLTFQLLPTNLHSQATQFQGLLHWEWHLHINTCSSPFGCLPWPSLPEQLRCASALMNSVILQPHLLPPCTTPTQFHISANQAWVATTASVFSFLHHNTTLRNQSAKVINLFSNLKYLCVHRPTGGSANHPPLWENLKGS